MSTELIAVNARRQVHKLLTDWGETNGITTKVRTIRAPLEDDEDEAVVLRYGAYFRRKTRAGQYRAAFVFEFHCMSKRGDLRSDRKADRAAVLAAMIEAEFQEKDIDLLDYAGSSPDTRLGSLQFNLASWRNADQRATIHGDSVDYTMETPKVEHIVVSYTATINTDK